MISLVLVIVGASIGWLIGRIIYLAYKAYKLRKLIVIVKPTDGIKEIIESSLPKLPIGCMWKVEKITKNFAYLLDKEVDPFNSVFGYRPRVVWDDTPEWDEVTKSRHTTECMFARFILEDPSGEVAQVDIRLDGDTDFLESLKYDIENKCTRLVNEYNKKNAQWDGIYLPGVTNE